LPTLATATIIAALSITGAHAGTTAKNVVCKGCVGKTDLANKAVTAAKIKPNNVYFNRLHKTVRNRITELEDKVARLEAALATSLELNDYVKVVMVERETTGGAKRILPTVRFEGANVQIVDGTGKTIPDASSGPKGPSGLGNLIVGYDEERSVGDSDDVCSDGKFSSQRACESAGATWALNHKLGSHNLVVGTTHNYSQAGAVVLGQLNTANRNASTVTGGFRNTASGLRSSVSGGEVNTASGVSSSVSGGDVNTASGKRSSVSGGSGNLASGTLSSVTGGVQNDATGFLSSVSGGRQNKANSESASISGGAENTASGKSASVSGGARNVASGELSSVSGGVGNKASGEASSVRGGVQNVANGDGSSVSGGVQNSASGNQSTVSGGLGNGASGKHSSVSGGTRNRASGELSTVSGGARETAAALHAHVP
jgi:hypothetical protein